MATKVVRHKGYEIWVRYPVRFEKPRSFFRSLFYVTNAYCCHGALVDAYGLPSCDPAIGVHRCNAGSNEAFRRSVRAAVDEMKRRIDASVERQCKQEMFLDSLLPEDDIPDARE